MKKTWNRTTLVLSLVALLVFAGCSLFPGIEVPDYNEPDPEDPRTLLLLDHFNDSEVGEVPVGWTEIQRRDGAIAVVSDSDFSSGRALNISTNKLEQEKGQQVRLDKALDPDKAKNAEVIAIQFKIKWIEGVFNGYIRDSSDLPLVDWSWGSDEQLIVRSTNILPLRENEVYQIRFVADRTTERIAVYVDDMEEPEAANIKFRNTTSTWENTVFRLASSPKNDAVHESIVGDIEIWVVE